LRRAEGVPEGRQAQAAVVAVAVAAVAVAAVDMVVVVVVVAVAAVVDMAVVAAADIWVEVARVQDWAVAARRTVRAAPWRVTATVWRTTAPTRAPCMPPTRWPANTPRLNTNMRHPSLPAQIIIIITLIAASPSLADPLRNMVTVLTC
jgi:hypothetical protein